MSCCRKFTYERTRAISKDELLTLTDTVCALKMRRPDAMRFLERNQLIRSVENRNRVLWGDVLTVLGERNEELKMPRSHRPKRHFRMTKEF